MSLLRSIAGLSVGVVACAPAVPAEPTWVDDVRPILQANCARCHGLPASGGAPTDFRLDVYEDTRVPVDFTGQTRLVRGAQSMSRFVHARASVRGDMPRRGPALTDRQRAVLDSWWLTGARGTNNTPPTISLTAPLADGDQRVNVSYEVSDPDSDAVVGTLYYGANAPDALVYGSALHDGRGTVVWDTGQVAPGAYTLYGRISDGTGDLDVELGTLNVAHTSGTAPTIVIVEPERDAVILAGENPEVVFSIADPDSPATDLTATMSVVRGSTERTMTATGPWLLGENRVPWDLANIAPAPNWRVKITVSDGANTRSVLSAPVIVSNTTTTLSYAADVAPLLLSVCVTCHDGYVDAPLNTYDEVFALRGRIWRRAVQKGEMPPVSAAIVLDDPSFVSLTPAELEMLAEWLLAGAPP